MDKLLAVLKECCPDVDFQSEKQLMSGRVFDSVKMVSVISEIEAEFSISILATDIKPENFDSIEQIWTLIQKRREKK